MLPRILEDFGEKLGKVDLFTQAAALAYYTAFSLAPLLLLTIYTVARINVGLQVSLIAQVRGLVGEQAGEALDVMITGLSRLHDPYDLNSLAGWTGVAALAVSASGIFAQLQTALNAIFETPTQSAEDRSWFAEVRIYVMRRIVSFGMVLAFVFISIVSLLVSSALSLVTLKGFALGKALDTLLSLSVFSLLFCTIFKWMPDCKIRFRAALAGGLITSLLFDFGKTLIGLYLGRTAVGSAYGAAGSLIVLLVWVYYSSLIVFLGAAITAAITRNRAQG